MTNSKKTYIITETRVYNDSFYNSKPLTLSEAVEYYKYTLECGAGYSHERGNKKINRNPKTIKSLITNLNNASSNAASNGSVVVIPILNYLNRKIYNQIDIFFVYYG